MEIFENEARVHVNEETYVSNVHIREGQKETILKHNPKFSDFFVPLSFVYPVHVMQLRLKGKQVSEVILLLLFPFMAIVFIYFPQPFAIVTEYGASIKAFGLFH